MKNKYVSRAYHMHITKCFTEATHLTFTVSLGGGHGIVSIVQTQTWSLRESHYLPRSHN